MATGAGYLRRFWRSETVATAVKGPRLPDGQRALAQVLLFASQLIVTLTIWTFYRHVITMWSFAATSVVWIGLLAVSPRLPWDRWERLPLLMPIVVFAGLAAIGAGGDGVAYGGLIVLCFVYVGMTLPPAASYLITPPAVAAWLVTQHAWSPVIAVRLMIAIPTWLLIGQLIAYRGLQIARDQDTLQDKAYTDALTGLPNRRQLDLRLAQAGDGDTLVMCDLDHFKTLNDRQGHAAGDRVLAEFGALLKSALRGQDVAGRYGGEEFVLILTDTSPEAALDVLQRLRHAWAALHPDVTFSTGISAIGPTSPIGVTLAAADEALYASKADGRNCDHILYQQVVRAS